jgi:hypothetical protein
MAPYSMGIKWDVLTPQVRAQITKDLIAIQNQPMSRNLLVYYEGDNAEVDTILQSLQIERVPLAATAYLWVLYQTGEDALPEPEHARQVVVRDMRIRSAETVLDTSEHNGFYLAPQGRNIAPTLDLNRPMPNWYPGGPTPDLVWLWS